jgi:hypothetical protein
MSAEIIPLPGYTMRDCTGNDTAGMSLADQCQNAWSNYYRQAVADGTCREKARNLADGLVQHRYGSMIDELRSITGRG